MPTIVTPESPPIGGGLVTSLPVPVAEGGTEATTPAAARTNLDAAQKFTPVVAVFEAAATLPALYDYLADTERPEFDTGNAAATIYVNANGSDTTGTGTTLLPYATFKRAFQACAASPTSARTIRLQGAGPFNAGGINLHDLNLITVEGDEPTVALSRTITSVGASSASVGLILTDADGAMGVDAHRGRLVKFTSGVLDTQYGVVVRNAANQLEVTQDTTGATFLVPSIGDTYDILTDWVTTWDFPDRNDYVIESSAGSAFKHVRFIGTPKYLFVNDTDKLDFIRCRFEITGLLAGRGGSIFLSTCSLANAGETFSDWGMLTTITEGVTLLQNGTFIDAVNAAANKSFISALTVGMIETRGEIAYRDLGTKGILIRGSGIIALNARRGSIFNLWRFVDCAAGILANDAGEGWGWAPMDLPTLHGNISGAYTLTATGGGRARLGAGSTVTDSTGTASVSADDGATNSAQNPDGTYIEGGSPAPAGFAPVGVATGNTLWVDADFGDDGTAVSDRQDLPFLTVGAAITASLSGDVIHVRPGVYAESGLTMTAGTVINGESWQTTSIGSAAAVADILTMGTDCGVNGITVIVPTAAHAGILHTAGTGSVTGINIQGDGATGIGDGISKTGTGKLIGGLIRCETGGLNSYVRVSAGVLALDDVHCPQSAGTIASAVLAENGVWQCQGLNVGNTNVVDAIKLAGTATIRVYSPNISNCSNSVHLTSDGPNVTIIGGKISATLRTVWVDSGLTGTGSTVRCLGTVLDPLFDFPPAAAVNTEFVLQFNQQESNTRDSRQRLIGADLALGFPELGSAAWIGKGAPYSAGISVYTTDGTETMVGSVVTGGNQTDVTAEAGSRSASTFAFQALTPNNAIYFGSLRKDAVSTPLKFWGLMLDQVDAGAGGTYAHEIWDGAAWVQVGVMAVSVAGEYRYADSVYLRSASREMVHFGITASTTWAQSTVGAIASYHARIRILTTVTTAPTWERSRLIESASVVNQIGQRSANGLSKWRSTVSAAGMRWSGTGTANGQVDMGTGAISWVQDLDSAKLNSNGDDAYIHLLLPQGICTAHPLRFRLIYGYDVYVAQPTLQLDSQRVAVANNIVADPGGGLVPIARTVALTPLTTAVEGVRDSWTGEVLAPNQITRHTTVPLDISAYYEGDLVAMRFTLANDGGGTGTDILIYGIEIEGVQFTDGTIE